MYARVDMKFVLFMYIVPKQPFPFLATRSTVLQYCPVRGNKKSCHSRFFPVIIGVTTRYVKAIWLKHVVIYKIDTDKSKYDSKITLNKNV